MVHNTKIGMFSGGGNVLDCWMGPHVENVILFFSTPFFGARLR
jgi:hypothetical protein